MATIDKLTKKTGIPFSKKLLNPTSGDVNILAQTGEYVESFIEKAQEKAEDIGRPRLTDSEESDLRQSVEDILRTRLLLVKKRATKSQRKTSKKKKKK